MFPCSACRRHLREAERVCPFCGVAQRSVAPASSASASASFGAFALAAALLGSTACSPDTVSIDGGESTRSSTGSTTDATETGSTETESTGTDTDDTTTVSTSSSLSFYAGPDEDFGQISECDPFAQDCPEGEKCVPYGSTGGNWDANKCVPILGDGQAGEPCTYGGVVEATDDCGEDTHCWDVMDVEGQPIGVCTPFCAGTVDNPTCPEGHNCLVANDASIALCLTVCDPILQDCAGSGQACYWTFTGFACVFQTQDLPTGEPCGYINDCAPGNFCAEAELLPGCAGDKCCASYCDLEAPDTCVQPDHACAAFFGPIVLEGYEHVGVCIAAPP